MYPEALVILSHSAFPWHYRKMEGREVSLHPDSSLGSQPLWQDLRFGFGKFSLQWSLASPQLCDCLKRKGHFNISHCGFLLLRGFLDLFSTLDQETTWIDLRKCPSKSPSLSHLHCYSLCGLDCQKLYWGIKTHVCMYVLIDAIHKTLPCVISPGTFVTLLWPTFMLQVLIASGGLLKLCLEDIWK